MLLLKPFWCKKKKKEEKERKYACEVHESKGVVCSFLFFGFLVLRGLVWFLQPNSKVGLVETPFYWLSF